jgi:hypothetical protein
LTDNLDALKEQTGILSSILETEIALSDEAKKKYKITIYDVSATNQKIKESIHDTKNRLLVAQDSVLHIIKNYDDCEQVLLQLDEGHNILLRQTIDESSRLVDSKLLFCIFPLQVFCLLLLLQTVYSSLFSPFSRVSNPWGLELFVRLRKRGTRSN